MPYSTLTVSALAVLAVQLLLCHRVRSLFLRLLPAAAFSLILALCAAAYLISGGRNALEYTVLGLYSALMLAVCGLGWAVRALWRKLPRGQRGSQDPESPGPAGKG